MTTTTTKTAITRHYGDSHRKGKVERFCDCALLWIWLLEKNLKDKLASFVTSLALANTLSLDGKELQECDLEQISCPLLQIY